MISSLDNEKVRLVRSLYAKKRRYEERAFVVEGVRLVDEAVGSGVKPLVVLYHAEALDRTPLGRDLHSRLGAGALPVTERVFKSIADTVEPQGVLAALPFPKEPAAVEGHLALILDGLRDPGNLGTIFRTAAAAGVKSVVTTGDTVDVFSPKVVRAGMGAHFRLSFFVDKGWTEIRALVDGRATALAAVREGTPYYDLDWKRPSALIVSSEAHGASEDAGRLANELTTIPMASGVESLNAAVAAAVIMFEAFRQQESNIANG